MYLCVRRMHFVSYYYFTIGAFPTVVFCIFHFIGRKTIVCNVHNLNTALFIMYWIQCMQLVENTFISVIIKIKRSAHSNKYCFIRFAIFWLWACMMKLITETCDEDLIRQHYHVHRHNQRYCLLDANKQSIFYYRM